MKARVLWKEGMEFGGSVGEHLIPMDAIPPVGKNKGATPKQLVALGLVGCTAMDVIALLKKHKQSPDSFEIDIEIQSTTSHPVVFEKAILNFDVKGPVAADKLIEAVTLSQTKYCGVSAMLSKAFPIEYRIHLNGNEIGTGKANFNT